MEENQIYQIYVPNLPKSVTSQIYQGATCSASMSNCRDRTSLWWRMALRYMQHKCTSHVNICDCNLMHILYCQGQKHDALDEWLFHSLSCPRHLDLIHALVISQGRTMEQTSLILLSDPCLPHLPHLRNDYSLCPVRLFSHTVIPRFQYELFHAAVQMPAWAVCKWTFQKEVL